MILNHKTGISRPGYQDGVTQAGVPRRGYSWGYLDSFISVLGFKIILSLYIIIL